MDITKYRDEMLAAYDRVEDQSVAIACLQAPMQAEIALQLHKTNGHLEIIASALNTDRTPGKLEDIATTLENIRRYGLTVEKA